MDPNIFEHPALNNNFCIEEIHRQIVAGKLNLSPCYQRPLVWVKQWKQDFIQSIMYNQSIPPIFVNLRREDFKQYVIDGKQRLSAIMGFMEGQITNTNGMRFADLTMEQKADFNLKQIIFVQHKYLSLSQERIVFNNLQRQKGLTPGQILRANVQENVFIDLASQYAEQIMGTNDDLHGHLTMVNLVYMLLTNEIKTPLRSNNAELTLRRMFEGGNGTLVEDYGTRILQTFDRLAGILAIAKDVPEFVKLEEIDIFLMGMIVARYPYFEDGYILHMAKIVKEHYVGAANGITEGNLVRYHETWNRILLRRHEFEIHPLMLEYV